MRALALLLILGCAAPQVVDEEDEALDAPAPPRLRLRVVDELGAPALGTFVRVMECCHTERGPCGRIPVDREGRAELEVCPGASTFVHVTLTPDPRRYRVSPIREVEVRGDTEVELSLVRHEKALERYRE